MPRCILKVQDIKSPISGTPRGMRVLIALPNMASRTMHGKPCPSFDKPFLLTLFGDYCDGAEVVANIHKIRAACRKMGFTEITPV